MIASLLILLVKHWWSKKWKANKEIRTSLTRD